VQAALNCYTAKTFTNEVSDHSTQAVARS